MADTWYAIVDGSGNLVSSGTVIGDQASLSAKGYSVITLSGNPTGQVWDVASHTFKPPPSAPTVITTWQFIQRFSAGEFAEIVSSTDPQVRMFLLMLQTSTTITLQDPIVVGGLAYLVNQNLLTADRATAIEAP